MHVNIVVINSDDLLVEYEWESLAAFKSDMENRKAKAASFPALDSAVHTVDCEGNGVELHWNEEGLRNWGIVSVKDFYDWISRQSHWFLMENRPDECDIDFHWFLKKTEYEKYQNEQREISEKDCDNNDREHIGSVRAGDLCFDILKQGNRLWFDLYVGGVDTGYGYSKKSFYEGYPYDFCDEASFVWALDVSRTEFEKFRKILERYIRDHIFIWEKYITERGKIRVSLIEKANEELKLW